jgi:hypothetical protein
MCVERVSAMCTAGVPRSRSVALEGRLVGCLYNVQITIRQRVAVLPVLGYWSELCSYWLTQNGRCLWLAAHKRTLPWCRNYWIYMSGSISSLCFKNLFYLFCQDPECTKIWVYLSSEQGVFNKLDFKIVILASFEPNLNFIWQFLWEIWHFLT